MPEQQTPKQTVHPHGTPSKSARQRADVMTGKSVEDAHLPVDSSELGRGQATFDPNDCGSPNTIMAK